MSEKASASLVLVIWVPPHSSTEFSIHVSSSGLRVSSVCARVCARRRMEVRRDLGSKVQPRKGEPTIQDFDFA